MASGSQSRVRVAVIGCGAITQSRYVPALLKLRDRFDVCAVVNPSQRSRDFVGARFPTARRFEAVADPIEMGEPDAALVLTPPNAREEIVEHCLGAGLHVLAEKPLGLTAEVARSLTATAARARRTLAVAHTRRYDPTYAAASDRLRKADVIAARAVTLETPSQGVIELAPLGRELDPRPEFEQGIGSDAADVIRQALGTDAERALRYYRWVLAESLVHDLDLLATLLEPIRRVEYCGYGERHVGVSAVVSCGSTPVTLNWTLTPKLARYDQLFQFDCEDARYSLRYPSPFLPHASATLTTQTNASPTGDVERVEAVSLEDSFVRLLEAFAGEVEAEDDDQSSASDAVRALTVAEALARAEATGGAVDIDTAG